MKRQISFAQYRSIDLPILTLVMAVCEAMIYFAASFWYADQLYVASTVAAMVTLVVMRWGPFAAIQAALGGLLLATLSGGTWQQYLIYGLGNLAGLGALGFLKLFGKERIRRDSFLSVTLALLVQALMLLGRAAVAALLGYPLNTCLGFITTDILSGLLTMLVIWVVRRIDGLFEDQKHYLLRIQSEHQV